MALKTIIKNLCFAIMGCMIIGCSPLKKLTILVDMEPDQRQYLKNTLLYGYEKKTAIKVNVFDYKNADSLEEYLKKYSGRVNLVEVPLEKSDVLARKGFFKPLDSFLTSEELRFFNDNFLLGSFGMVSNRPTLIPRSFETPVLVFSKSKVADALKAWSENKEIVAQNLKTYNGLGLPAGYKLEDDPSRWDMYDIAVIGLLWTKGANGGSRIAHVSRKNAELFSFIEGGVYRCGGDSLAVMGCRGDALYDFLHWESVLSRCGVYNQKMWDKGWGRDELMGAYVNGDIYCMILTLGDCFRLHGTGHAERRSMLQNPDDLGLALLPQGCSVELDNNGNVIRRGSRGVATKSTWWAIPYNASSALMSYRLAKYLSDTLQHVAEVSRFGKIPVRKEVVDTMDTLIKDPWIKKGLEVSLQQIVHNAECIVSDRLYSQMYINLYIDIWYGMIVAQNWAPQNGGVPERGYIQTAIEQRYQPKLYKQ
jgi:hypothetical protein